MTSPPLLPRRLTLCVITLNESRNLAACLASASSIADEIVVLDSGSTDGTAALAESMGARVHVEAFRGFGPQKNRCFDLASGDWILSLDADERLTPELAAEIDATLRAPGAACASSGAGRRAVATAPYTKSSSSTASSRA